MNRQHIVILGGWIMVLAVAMAVIWPTTHVMAVNKIWDAGGSDNLWSTPENWVGDTVPLVTDVIYLMDNPPDGSVTIELTNDVTIPYMYFYSSGNRDYTITSANGSKINFTSGTYNFLYGSTFTTRIAVDCDISDTKTYIQVDRDYPGVLSLNGRCDFTGYLFADGSGTLELGGSNSFSYVNNYDGGEILVKHPHALGNGYYYNFNPGGTLSFTTNATLEGILYAVQPTNLRLKDSGTNDVTLTVKGYCYGGAGINGMITVMSNAGTSTGDLAIWLTAVATHTAEWTLTTNSTIVFANASGTAKWGTVDSDGSIGGGGAVVVNSGDTLNLYATNSYTGGTTIRAGKLLIADNDRLPVDGDLVVESGGIFFLFGKSQTMGGLSGDGMVSLQQSATYGTLTVNGTLSPGMSTGTLTIENQGDLILSASSTSLFELGSLSGSNDKVAFTVVGGGAGDLTLGGTLQIENLGGLEKGLYTLFDLYTGGVISGSYSSINLPSGYSGILTTSGDVVLEITAVPPNGTCVIVR